MRSRASRSFKKLISVNLALLGITAMTMSSALGDGSFPITFEPGTSLPGINVFGGATFSIEPGPEAGDSNALKIVRDNGDDFAGFWVDVFGIPNDAGPQTISARVHSPAAGIPMVAKAEYGDNMGSAETEANETVVMGWQTLSWTFTDLVAPFSYSRFVILPNLGMVDTTATSYYFDNIDLVVAAFSADGAVESTSGGFKFPDGTVQMTAVTAGPSAPAMPTYEIGDTGPAGGIVFYLEPGSGGTQGLEAARADQSAGTEWGCYGTAITGADGTTVGTGKQNTIDIYNGCSTRPIAASLAVDHRGPTLDTLGWYLPSKDELNLMFDNIGPGAAPPNTNVGGFANDNYWSSSERSDLIAWFQSLGNGLPYDDLKVNAFRVRAVRAF